MNIQTPFTQQHQAFSEFRVGSKYPLPDSYLHTEGSLFNLNTCMCSLVVLIENPRLDEVSDYQFGKAQFGLYLHGPVLFLLSKFGTQPWADSPYSIHMNPIEKIGLPEGYVEGLRFGLWVMLVDSATSKIQALRLVAFNLELSRLLARRVIHQLQQPLAGSEYNKLVSAAYKCHPTGKSMVQQALIVTSCPEPH